MIRLGVVGALSFLSVIYRKYCIGSSYIDGEVGMRYLVSYRSYMTDVFIDPERSNFNSFRNGYYMNVLFYPKFGKFGTGVIKFYADSIYDKDVVLVHSFVVRLK